MNYKKKSIYCTEKIKTVTTTQTTINIVQNINNNKNTATVISKPNKNTSNVKKQIPLSSYIFAAKNPDACVGDESRINKVKSIFFFTAPKKKGFFFV